ncbi:MAG TPA: hypothetical protein PLN21_03770 [Gemmatales bacterium]|nr:hypothetical protein [Gemmatales bacterium]
MRQNTTNRIALGLTATVVLLIAGVLLSVNWLDPKTTVPSHSFANAQNVRISQLHDQWDPLVQHSVEIVSTLKTTYGKLVESPEKMSLAVLVYVSTYFGTVKRVTAYNGAVFRYPVEYRVANSLLAETFYMPMHLIDVECLRPQYWKILRHR